MHMQINQPIYKTKPMGVKVLDGKQSNLSDHMKVHSFN